MELDFNGQKKPTIHRKIENSDVPLPVNWKQFIDHPESKQDLENFLSLEIMRRAKSTRQNCDIVTAGGFQEEHTDVLVLLVHFANQLSP